MQLADITIAKIGKQQLKKMKEFEGEIIPVWHSRRKKTNKFFITFNSDEATRFMIHYLEYRNEKLRYNPKNKNKTLKRIKEIFYDIN